MNNQETTTPKYDPNIVPTDVADRMEREGENFKQTPDQQDDSAKTATGYTVDQEGRLNNFAVEPEMYIDQPGDLRPKEEAKVAERAETVQEVNQTNEDGKLTMSEDNRGKGTGVI